MKKIPRHIKRQLRKIALSVTEAELHIQLAQLAEKFDEWRQEAISSRELRHSLHTFVSGPSREVLQRNRRMPDDIVIADAVACGILTQEDIPQELWPYLHNSVKFYQTVLTEE